MRAIQRRLAQIEASLPDPPSVPKRGCPVCNGPEYSTLFVYSDSNWTRHMLGNDQPLPDKCPGCGGNILDADPVFRITYQVVGSREELEQLRARQAAVS